LVTSGKSPLSPNRNRLQFTVRSQWPHLRAIPASWGRKPVQQPDCLRGVLFPSWPVRRRSSSSGLRRDASVPVAPSLEHPSQRARSDSCGEKCAIQYPLQGRRVSQPV